MVRKEVHLIAFAIALLLCSVSTAATLVDFKPLPSSSTIPEFRFDGPVGSPSFKTAAGSIGNGDGTLPVPTQSPGGLGAEAAFVIPAIPGSAINAGNGTTEFFDSTLVFTGLTASGLAQNVGAFTQPLGAGTFDLLSTDPDAGGPLLPTLLLRGSLGGATIVGFGGSGAVINSLSVNYTAGAIYDSLVNSGANPNGNSMSLSMLDVNPVFAIDGGTGLLRDFTANGTGQFSFNPVPEPSAALMLVLAAVGIMVGRRR